MKILRMINFFKKSFNKKLTTKILSSKKRKILASLILGVTLFFGGSKIGSGKIQNNLLNSNIEISVLNLRGGVSKLISRFKEHPRLVAEAVKLAPDVQTEIDNLIEELSFNNFNTKVQITKVKDLKNVFVIRGENEGIVFFREVGDTFEILGKSSTASEKQVMNLLKEFN